MADRYRLVYHYKNGGKKLFELFFEDGSHRKAFTLAEIDRLTTSYSNGDELGKSLNELFSGYENGYFTIEYSSNGTIKSMELVFNDMSFVRKMAGDILSDGKMELKDVDNYMNLILNKIENDIEFLNYMYTHRYINRYFMDALSYYLMLKNSDEKEAQSVLWQAKVKLRKEFMRYKTIRGLEVGLKNYELKKPDYYISNGFKDMTVFEQAKFEYELNHPIKNNKKGNKVCDGQMFLFDPDDFSKGRTK